MKKLMFATALVASAAAFADPINAIGFKGYDPGAKFVTGQVEKDEDGVDKSATYGYFCFEGDSDSSVVTNENPSTTKHTAFFASADDAKYLALDTEGGTLWRSIETLNRYGEPGSYVYSNGNARAVAQTGTYLDTLVQFTVTEDDAPEVGADDKLAIWLQAGEGTTNLMVRAKTYIADVENSTLADAVTNFTIAVSGITIEAGQWYRLTVKAIPNLLKTTDYGLMCGFQIYIDGQPAKNTLGATFTYADFQTYDMITSEMATLMEEGSVFASLGALDDTSLQGVGFKGTGAVDEIVWTDDNPLSASGVDFTLTWDANVTGVSYTIDGTTTDLSSETSPYTITGIAADTAVTVNASAADWYVISSGTGAVTAVAGGTNEIVAVLAATPGDAGATGLPASVSTAAAKAWADAKHLTPAQIAASSYAEESYLLNTDLLTTAPTLSITNIAEVTGGWTITVKASYDNSGTEATIALGEDEAGTKKWDINGTLKVKSAATLADLAGEDTETTYRCTEVLLSEVEFDENGVATITVTGSNKNFMKAVVE